MMIKSKHTFSGPADLKAVLRHSRNCRASDQRDLVYAFLGLAEKGYTIVPNYELSNTIVDVLIATAKRIVSHENSLDILSDAVGARGHLAAELLSWVPDWTSKETHQTPKLAPDQQLSSKYSATKDTECCFTFEVLGSGTAVLELESRQTAQAVNQVLSTQKPITGYQCPPTEAFQEQRYGQQQSQTTSPSPTLLAHISQEIAAQFEQRLLLQPLPDSSGPLSDISFLPSYDSSSNTVHSTFETVLDTHSAAPHTTPLPIPPATASPPPPEPLANPLTKPSTNPFHNAPSDAPTAPAADSAAPPASPPANLTSYPLPSSLALDSGFVPSGPPSLAGHPPLLGLPPPLGARYPFRPDTAIALVARATFVDTLSALVRDPYGTWKDFQTLRGYSIHTTSLAQIGDHVFIIHGAKHPFIIREQGKHQILISEAIVKIGDDGSDSIFKEMFPWGLDDPENCQLLYLI
jgi:hypothetical protein